LKHFREELKRSLSLLQQAGFLEAWKFRDDTVTVKRRY
jgi:hypothetical protein